MADETGADNLIDFKLYRYLPSLPAAIVAAVIFAILTSLHLIKVFKHRSLYFIAFTVGGLFETVGYLARVWSHFSKESVPAYSIQAIFILVAPALFAASIYMILGRIVLSLRAAQRSLIPVRFLTKIFVCGDVLSFTLQAAGGGIQAGGTIDLFNLGETVSVIGIFLQIAFFGLFVLVSLLFNKRIRDRPTALSVSGVIPWQRHLKVLYAVSTLILIRSIFRVIEFLGGNDGYLVRHEAFLYCFDAIFMAVVMVLFLVWYVDDLASANGKDREELSSSDGIMELEQGRR